MSLTSDTQTPLPVRFRVVLELTLPDADPWDPSDYGTFLDQVKQTLETAPAVNCKNVEMREALTIGPNDRYEDWRNEPKYNFSSFSPHTSYFFGANYPVPPVDPPEFAKVWDLMSRTESGELKDINICLAVGQALRPESDAQATIARVFVLRTLQAKKMVDGGASQAIFEKAADFPFERPVADEQELASLARFFRDSRT